EVKYSIHALLQFYDLHKCDLLNGNVFGLPLLENEYDEVVHIGQILKKQKEEDESGDESANFSRAGDFKYICRESLNSHVSSKSSKLGLTCYMEFNINLGWYVKMEDVLLEPRIVLYHNIISEAETEDLKTRSVPWVLLFHIYILTCVLMSCANRPLLLLLPPFHEDIFQLRRSLVQSLGDDGRRGYRTSQSAWMSHLKHPVVAKLDKRVEALTRLSAKKPGSNFFNEPFQVLNYGIGGQYKPHLDSFVCHSYITLSLVVIPKSNQTY
ncbi:unnamed protein product, partial [Owenia fusiformis]